MVDEVDGLIAAWKRERPDLPVDPMHVWSRIHRLAIHLDGARRASFAELGVELWEFDVLAALRKAGAPYRLSPGQLTRETHVTSGTMTNRVDRLEARGLVVRESHPDDGRGVLVELTASGRELVDAALTRLLEVESSLLADITAGERDQLVRALRILLSTQG